ncbi:copia protein [Tanacetum coccineum]
MELLRKHGMEKCDTVTTPMATAKIDADLESTTTDQTKYRSMIGGLMYLTASRPDIAFATFVCARYQECPTEKHLKEVKRIFRCLRQYINKGLCTSGGLQFLGDKLVKWSSKKQDCTAMSTAEADDSRSSIAISCNLVQHLRTKLNNIRYHFIKEHVEKVFHMDQQIIPAAQLVHKYQSIRRCNNYDVLQMETPENPFVAPVNIEIIESFMQSVGYQGVDDKKKDFIHYSHFTKLIITDLIKKFPSIPPRLEEDYHSIKDDILLVSVYTTGNVTVRGMLILDAFLTNEILATDDYKEYETMFVKVVVLMNQPQPVVSTQGTHRTTPGAHRTPTLTTASPQGKKRKQSVEEINSPQKLLKVTIRQKKQSTTSILPPSDDRERDEIAEATLLSLALHKTAIAAEAEENVAKVQEKLAEEEIEKMVEGDEDEESYASEFADSMINDDDDLNDDAEKTDDIAKEKDNDDYTDPSLVRTYATGSMETRNEQMQTPVPTSNRSPRKDLSSDKTILEELTIPVSPTTATTSKSKSKR